MSSNGYFTKICQQVDLFCRRLLCDHPDNDDSDHPAGSSHHEDVSDCETSSSNSKDADQVKSFTLEHYEFFFRLKL